MGEARPRPEGATVTAAIAQAFAIPPLMLGNSREPRSMVERGSLLIAQAEAMGMEPPIDPDVDFVILQRTRERLGITLERPS